MSEKKEARALKKALKQQKFEESKATFLAKVQSSPQPRSVAVPLVDSAPRLAPHLARAVAEAKKTPKKIGDGSRLHSSVTWCISQADRKDSWSWQERRDWETQEWDETIHPQLQSFAQLTWKEVDAHATESGHKKHHGHEIADLIQEAQQRWIDLGFEEFDSVFRFRLGATKRAWGYIVQSHFFFVWWDREHSLYPTGRS